MTALPLLLEKARRRKLTITANDERVDAATNRMKKLIQGILKEHMERIIAREIKTLRRKGKLSLEKAEQDKDLQDKLKAVLIKFGLRDADDAGRDMAARLDSDWIIPPALVNDIIKSKEIRIKQIWKEDLQFARAQIRKILLSASKEIPVPSVSEVAMRIRQIPKLVIKPGKTDISSLAFRAERIARTEAVQAQNTGIAEGMTVAGVPAVEWLAHRDGRSGDRRHGLMNGKTITVADMNSSDPKRWFRTPLGNRLRYPGDPEAPIKDTINCRCTLVPVRPKVKARKKA
jgi:hypothetical protein